MDDFSIDNDVKKRLTREMPKRKKKTNGLGLE